MLHFEFSFSRANMLSRFFFSSSLHLRSSQLFLRFHSSVSLARQLRQFIIRFSFSRFRLSIYSWQLFYPARSFYCACRRYCSYWFLSRSVLAYYLQRRRDYSKSAYFWRKFSRRDYICPTYRLSFWLRLLQLSSVSFSLDFLICSSAICSLFSDYYRSLWIWSFWYSRYLIRSLSNMMSFSSRQLSCSLLSYTALSFSLNSSHYFCREVFSPAYLPLAWSRSLANSSLFCWTLAYRSATFAWLMASFCYKNSFSFSRVAIFLRAAASCSLRLRLSPSFLVSRAISSALHLSSCSLRSANFCLSRRYMFLEEALSRSRVASCSLIVRNSLR